MENPLRCGSRSPSPLAAVGIDETVRCGAAGDCDRCLPPPSPRAVRFYGDPAPLQEAADPALETRLETREDGLPSYESAARRSGQWCADGAVPGAELAGGVKDWSAEKQDEWQDEGESIVANCSDSPLSNCLDSPELVPRIGFHNDVKECAI